MKYIITLLCMLITLPVAIYSEDKRCMNILIIVPSFPKIHDNCMLYEIIGLIDLGHNVHIYAPKKGDTAKVQEEVITYNLLSKTFFGKLPDNINLYDIIVFQLGHKAFNIKKTHNYKGKVVIRLRGYDMTGLLKKNPHAYDHLFKDCDLFLPVCKAFKVKLEKYGCPVEKIKVHYSGIDSSRFYFKEREYPQKGKPLTIVSVGRFVEKKGFIYGIKAIAQLIKRYPFIRYKIIGEGALKRKCIRLIRSLGIDQKVTIHGWYSHDEYIKCLDDTHILLAPSIVARNGDEEGIPNVIKEAMALGIIVIATNHSGNSEVIQDRISGYLVEERSSQSIVRAVNLLMQNPTEWLPIEYIARNTVIKKFDNKHVNNALEKIFLELLQ